jgi:LuxR family maltose regulon positive regulatory protein
MNNAESARTAPLAEIYAHKLFAPPQYHGAIDRTAILDRIFTMDRSRIILLQGPAGHGKSTVMQQAKSVCEAQGMRTGWLTFDDADNDMRRFSIHFQALLAAALGTGLDDAALQNEEQQSGSRRRSDWFINHLLRYGRPVALFLDEFQSITNKSILAFFKELLDHLPANVMVFVGSRSVPEIGLSRLIINKQALILRADDLRFTPTEAAQFFSEAQDLWINEDEVKSIYKRTEGWPAALQLFRLTLISPSVRKSLGDLGNYRPRELAEYLADNVLTLQPPKIQEFLLRTSLLTRLTAPLCDAVTGWHSSQEILLFLERTGLFLRSLDSELRWFKYHALFSSFLSEQLRNVSEESITEVHRRAAAWYREQGIYEEAIYHSIEIQDFGFASDVMNIWLLRLIPDAQLATVERWHEHLPLHEIEQRPDLAIKIAWALIFLRREQKLQPLLEMLKRLPANGSFRNSTNPDVVCAMAAMEADDLSGAFGYIQRVNVHDQEGDEEFPKFELGAGANLAAYFALTAGNFESAREYLALARAHNKKGSAIFSGGYTVGVTGMNFVVQGQLGEALERYRSGMAEQRFHLDKSFASASLVACYVQGLYEANELDDAEALFNQYHDTIAESVLLDFLAIAFISMARIHDIRGRSGKALEVLDEVENIGHTSRWPRLIRLINWERVRRALLRGETSRADSIVSRIPRDGRAAIPEHWVLFSEDVDGDAIGEIRVAIHKAQCDQAVKLIARELTLAQSQGRVRRQIKLLALDAIAQKGKNADNVAHRSLRKALQLAEPGGFVRSFLEEGDVLIGLLREEYQLLERDAAKGCDASFGVSGKFIETLLTAAGSSVQKTPAQGSSPPEPLTEALTDREKQILVYLGNGVSNKEMARRIFVSENTVKFHLKNIYSKLAVSSRLQAINAARQMGIIV